MSRNDQLPPRTVVGCFVATVVISAAGALVLGPQTAGWYVIGLGTVTIIIAVVQQRLQAIFRGVME